MYGSLEDSHDEDEQDDSVNPLSIRKLQRVIKDIDDDELLTIFMKKDILGEEQYLNMATGDISEFCNMKEISGECILFYIR